jgi:lactoylglutathione lyase
MGEVQGFSHVGLCVSDLARSRRFYCEGLGFSEALRLEFAGEPSATLLDLPGVDSRRCTCGATAPARAAPLRGARRTGDRAARAMNTLGLTHLSLRVAGVDAIAERLVALGGRALEHTRIHNPALGARAIFVLDPDGTRIELFESARPLA